MKSQKRIVLATFGSLGDLHPYLAVALGLKARGHQAVLATHPVYRQKVEALGLEFAPVRPDTPQDQTAAFMKRLVSWRGSEIVVREFIAPALRQSYEDTLLAAQGADLLVSHVLTFSVRLVAHQLSIPWVSSVLSPMLFFSRHDLPMAMPEPLMTIFQGILRLAGPDRFLALMRRSIKSWIAPYYQLCAELNLPSPHPLFEGQHSPHLILGLFSEAFGPRRPDWPVNVRITGFPFYDREDASAQNPPELTRFLRNGPPPIVFTLGSSAVQDAGRFYEQSEQAALRLGQRAVLLIGRDPRNVPAKPLPPEIIAVPYAPYSEVLPRAAVTVHQGGVGTTAQGLSAGKPMLVMPYSHDQPDNARRIVNLGVGRTIKRGAYNADSAVGALGELLSNPAYAQTAERLGERIRSEDGVAAACDALEEMLRS